MLMTIAYIAEVCGGELSSACLKQTKIEGFFTDSRSPEQNKMFLALKGERVDGNSFVPKILSEGYAAITDDKENLKYGGNCVYVPDVREALLCLARHYRENELADMPFIGITGSVGKTTTKDMIALALSSELTVHKTKGNSNSQIGLPQTVLATDPTVDCAVVELGMSMPGEMENISRCAKPDISVITNIGYSHIENLGSREAIRDEKLKIAMFSDENSVLLLNGDEPLLKSVDLKGKRAFYVSLDNSNCDCYATETENGFYGVSFKAHIFGEICEVKLSVCGEHFITNALFALACAYLRGLDIKLAAKSLGTYESDGKRQYLFEKNGHTVISDCYNASPESMKAALSVLAVSKGRRIAVLGDMLELGVESPTLHRIVGECVGSCADVLVTYGELSKDIYDKAEVSEKYAFSTDEREAMKEFLGKFIKQGDTVLYKASNGMHLGEAIV